MTSLAHWCLNKSVSYRSVYLSLAVSRNYLLISAVIDPAFQQGSTHEHTRTQYLCFITLQCVINVPLRESSQLSENVLNKYCVIVTLTFTIPE